MIVTVFERPDGTVRVLHPNPRHQRPGESDVAFLARMAGQAEQRDLALRGLRAVDLDVADLPAERLRANPGGRPLNVRDAWRVVGGRVVVDESKVREIERGRVQE